VFANVASATLLSPRNIYYLYSYNADSRPELLERKLRSVINYLDNRNVHTNVTMIIAWQVPDKGQKDQLKQSLEAIRDRSISGNGKAVFDDYEIIDCADTKEAAERLLDALKDKNVDLFDGTARLFDSQIGNSTMLSGLFARGVSYFELDWRRKQFRECSGCEYLKYIRDDSYVRISDMFALMNAVDNSFNLPEFAEDYEALWSIYTGKAGGDTPYETAVSSWNKTCGLLAAYEEARNPVVALEMPALHESTTSHTAFLPEFAYSKLDEIIGELISYGLIEEGSSVTGYTSDTCRVDIISTDTVWNRLKASFATPHLFMGYYGMHVCKKGRLTELRCSAPRVSGLDITSGGSRDAVAVMNVLSMLDKAGFIVNLVRSKENRDLVSFSYSSPRIKKLLTTEGEILEVYIYYELLRSGLFDDIACGYEFRWENGGVMNELDCVLVKGFRTIIVECKATKLLKLEHYHKLHSLADHFGIGATKVLVGNTYRDGDAINEQRNDVQRSRGDQLNIITISSREEIENIAETMKKILEKA